MKEGKAILVINMPHEVDTYLHDCCPDVFLTSLLIIDWFPRSGASSAASREQIKQAVVTRQTNCQ